MPARPTTTRSVPAVEHVGVDLRRRADDQGVRAGDGRRGARRRRARAANVDGVPGSAKAVETTVGDRFGDEDASHGSMLIGQTSRNHVHSTISSVWIEQSNRVDDPPAVVAGAAPAGTVRTMSDRIVEIRTLTTPPTMMADRDRVPAGLGHRSRRSSASSCSERSHTQAATSPVRSTRATSSALRSGSSHDTAGSRGAAQPRHRHPAGRAAQRRRSGDEEPPASVGRRARPRMDHVDVRPARAAQRLVQHRGAQGRGRRVPRRLLRPDDRLDQRPRRVRTGSWSPGRPTPPRHPSRPSQSGPTIEVATPDDIVVLRRTDPAAADAWRHNVRDQLGARLLAPAAPSPGSPAMAATWSRAVPDASARDRSVAAPPARVAPDPLRPRHSVPHQLRRRGIDP